MTSGLSEDVRKEDYNSVIFLIGTFKNGFNSSIFLDIKPIPCKNLVHQGTTNIPSIPLVINQKREPIELEDDASHLFSSAFPSLPRFH